MMASQYAFVENGVVVSVRGRPNWYFDDGAVVDDATLLVEGIYPVVHQKPTLDQDRQSFTQNEITNWQINADHVAVTYTITSKDLGQVVDDKVKLINSEYDRILKSGFTYDFGTKTATLPDGTTETAGVRTLQTRPEDRERWQATNQVAAQYRGGGAPNEPMRPIRTADNARVPVTAKEANDVMNAMQAYFGKALDALWNHKDAVRQLATVDDVVAYDHTTGWPT